MKDTGPIWPESTGRRGIFGWCLDGHHENCRKETRHATCSCPCHEKDQPRKEKA